MLSKIFFRDTGGKDVQPAVRCTLRVYGEGLHPAVLHGGHAPVDGLSQSVELGLIVGHDAHRAVGVQIPGHFREGKAELGDLLHGEFEERLVVGLEVNLAAGLEHLPVELEEVAVGQAALGVAVAGPGIAEVDVNAVHFAGSEKVGQLVGVGVHEEHVGKSRVHAPFHGHHHGVGHPLHSDEQHVRLSGGSTSSEAALAAAQLQPQLPCTRFFFFRMRIKKSSWIDFRVIPQSLVAVLLF